MMKKILALVLVIVGLLVSGGAVLYALDQQPIRAITPADVAKAMELKEREAAVVTKEAEIAKKEQTQAQVQKDIDEKLARLATMQGEVKDQMAAIKTTESQAFTNLIKIYSAMKASKVAPLLDAMDDPTVVRIFRAMKTDQVAQIIPKMKQDKAVAVSEQLGLVNRQ